MNSGTASPYKQNLQPRATWHRLFFMLVTIMLYSISRAVVSLVVVIQFFWVLFNGETHKSLLQLGGSLAIYTYQIIRYLSFNTEARPFPFDLDWPSAQQGIEHTNI
ncbi:MAG: DUF4389 domain-containing protein [Gammaproteobacteria bacterium]